MKATIFLLSLVAASSAALNPHLHSRSHVRRERFLQRHAEEVKAAIGHEPAYHSPFLKDTHSAAQRKSQAEAKAHASHHHHSKAFQNDTICPTHNPFIRTKLTHVNGAALPNNTRNIEYSGNWCGVVQKAPPASDSNSGNSTFISVEAIWTMPTLAAPANASTDNSQETTFYGSQWVGIDGYTYGGAILQAGTTSAVTIAADGTATNSASAWFEWFPDPESPIAEADLAVSPGDQISCSVQAINATAGTVVIKNLSSGQEYTTDFAAPSDAASLQGVNAEWIYEDFSAGGLVPFASFTPVKFEGCNATTADGGAVGLTQGTVVDLVAGNDVVCNAAVTDETTLMVAYGPATMGAGKPANVTANVTTSVGAEVGAGKGGQPMCD